jgi:hypothetical protein
MPTYNFIEIIHNIWPQQSKKRNAYMYATTLNDYLKSFEQTMLYYVFDMVATPRYDQIGMNCDCEWQASLVILYKWLL